MTNIRSHICSTVTAKKGKCQQSFAPEHGTEQTSLSENVCSSSVEFCAHSHSVEKSIPSYVNHHITSLQWNSKSFNNLEVSLKGISEFL